MNGSLLTPAGFGLALATAASVTIAPISTAHPVAPATPAPSSTPRDHAAQASVDYQALVDRVHEKYKGLKEGDNAHYIPFLAKVPSELFAVAIVMRDGTVYGAGDMDYRFAIESASKPFTAALVMEKYGGPDALLQKIGVEPTGMPFNSVTAVELLKNRSVNPLVNASAMASVSIIEAQSESDRWAQVLSNMEAFAGDELPLLQECYQSEYDTCWNNRGIANILYNDQRLYCEPEETLRVYTKQCSVGVSTLDLGMMGSTLANEGVNPKTGERVLESEHVPELLSLMMTAGFYDESGMWSYTTGLPAKTGVGGGIVAVVPGEFAIVGFSPRIDKAGNSVRAQHAIRDIANELNAGLFGPNSN